MRCGRPGGSSSCKSRWTRATWASAQSRMVAWAGGTDAGRSAFQFRHHDVYRRPDAGEQPAYAEPFPVEDNAFSLVLAHSLSTWARPGGYYLTRWPHLAPGAGLHEWFFSTGRASRPGPGRSAFRRRGGPARRWSSTHWFLTRCGASAFRVRTDPPPSLTWTVFPATHAGHGDHFNMGEDGAEWLCGATDGHRFGHGRSGDHRQDLTRECARPHGGVAGHAGVVGPIQELACPAGVGGRSSCGKAAARWLGVDAVAARRGRSTHSPSNRTVTRPPGDRAPRALTSRTPPSTRPPGVGEPFTMRYGALAAPVPARAGARRAPERHAQRVARPTVTNSTSSAREEGVRFQGRPQRGDGGVVGHGLQEDRAVRVSEGRGRHAHPKPCSLQWMVDDGGRWRIEGHRDFSALQYGRTQVRGHAEPAVVQGRDIDVARTHTCPPRGAAAAPLLNSKAAGSALRCRGFGSVPPRDEAMRGGPCPSQR